jgi:ABC-2 type transport system permease protein
MSTTTIHSTFRILTNSMALQLKTTLAASEFSFMLLQPVIFTVISVGTYVYGKKPDFGLFAIIGTGLISIWNGNLFTSGEIIRNERRTGTLSLVMATPTPLFTILLGKSFANAIVSVLAMGITFLTGILAFHLPLGIRDPLAFLVGLILVIVSITCLGLIFGSLFILTRNAGEFVSVANFPVYILSGLSIPLTILPLWTRPLSNLLAPTWGNVLLNHAAAGGGGSMLPNLFGHRPAAILADRVSSPASRYLGAVVMQANWRLFWSGTRASWATYLVELTPAVFFGMRIPRIILQSLFFVFLAKAAGGDTLARFALIGNAIQMAVFMVMLSMEVVIESEKWNDTFLYLIAAPSSWFPSLLGKSTAYYGDALFAATVSFAVLIPVLHVQIMIVNLLKAIPFILIILISACALGWGFGAFSLPIRYGYTLCNLFAYAMMIFCGINIPTSALPPAVRFIGNLLPVTHGLQAVRAIIDGASYASVMPLVGKEILIALVYSTIAWLIFGYRLRVTRQRGTYGLV